ncbi:hypothetical protein J5J83_14360 [Azoarcus sp. L1K30]|uniref:hypothetical protein n=1 Tax=Azoarcus sp. L1K30 TaxID=2820277 RepID=UPI001B83053C|nr:hypothetical protein [Azoarcus sp. L1K30]MBR0567302.1 hypothetical protein [Azoarcus sp. L1K30]
MNTENRAVSCLGCAHYYITHDTALPYGCHALRFKSRAQPWREVLAASGSPCQYFAAKAAATRAGRD